MYKVTFKNFDSLNEHVVWKNMSELQAMHAALTLYESCNTEHIIKVISEEDENCVLRLQKTEN